MRLFISFILAIIVSVSIFFGMQIMTNVANLEEMEKQEIPHLVYLRDNKDTKINKKKRIKPKKPKIEKPKKIEFEKPKMKIKIQKDIKIKPLMTKNIDLSSIPSLAGAKINVDVGLIDARTLMTISKSFPRYPRRAKLQKKEGFVQLQFKIDENGYVKDPIVLKAKPQGIFEESAIRAIKRWRFKPTKGVQANSFINATIRFNYRLSK